MEQIQFVSPISAAESFDCPACLSGHVRRVGVFEHTTCGFVDVAARFTGDGTHLGCPKCEATLAVTDDDLRCVAFLFCCSGCDQRFDVDVSFSSLTPRSIESD
jgi:hypothetical protein